MSDSLGDRMKVYESVSKQTLMRRTPVIIRLDGCHFHTFTKGFQKPFDDILIKAMQCTMEYLCQTIQGCVFGYTQSDEITLVLADWQNFDTSAWFDNQVQKIASVSASKATMWFNKSFGDIVDARYEQEWEIVVEQPDNKYNNYFKKIGQAIFDSRVFNLPKEEVCNCILWRQQDAERNSIQGLAQSLYSHKQLEGLSCANLQNKMFSEKGINWNELPTYKKRGTACLKVNGVWQLDLDMPILKGESRAFVEDTLVFNVE